MNHDPHLLTVRNLSVEYTRPMSGFFRNNQKIETLHRINFEIGKGEIFGLVGESGCGKTTLARAIAGLIPFEGTLTLDGENLTKKRTSAQHKKVQMVFQDPFGSLNPKMKIGRILEEPLLIHHIGAPGQRAARVDEMLRMIGLDPEARERYPRQLSGGQRQRVSIGCSLMSEPLLLLADEPVSALDVSVQAQILNLLSDLHEKLGLSYLFISHNLDVVYYLCDRIAVMFQGRIIEIGEARELYDHPAHPYTRSLLLSGSLSSLNTEDTISETGRATSNLGCPYYPLCPEKNEGCGKNVPELVELSENGHAVRCHKAK